MGFEVRRGKTAMVSTKVKTIGAVPALELKILSDSSGCFENK
jgi:hypothetical protein